MSDDEKHATTGRNKRMSLEAIRRSLALLEEAGVIRKTGELRNGRDVWVAVPGKDFKDYLAWLRRHEKC